MKLTLLRLFFAFCMLLGFAFFFCSTYFLLTGRMGPYVLLKAHEHYTYTMISYMGAGLFFLISYVLYRDDILSH
jgi:hypothetical protein